METFDFPYHIISDEYPDSGKTVSFGGGYTFASAPRGPDQIIFQLTFKALFQWIAPNGTVDRTVVPAHNALRMQSFYEAHRMYEPFLYAHPTRGTQTVRFHKAFPRLIPMENLVITDGVSGARGHQIEPITITLIQKL